MPTNHFKDILDALEGENISPEFRKLLEKKADQMFREQKAREEWEKLTELSGVIISSWEVKEILAQVPAGKSVVINDGEIYVGTISKERLEKMTKLRKKIPGKKFLNVDDAQDTYRKIVTKSFAEPAIVKGFENAWASQVKKVKENSEQPLMNLFLNFIENHPKNKVTCNIRQIGRQDFLVTTSVEGLKTKVVTNTFGRMVGYFSPDGSYENLDVKK